jgi:hypothetical protein
MSLCVPHAWTAGDDATSTALQTLTDSITQLQGGTPTASGTVLDFFSAAQATAQTGLTASTFVSLTFDTTSELVDAAAGHSTVTNNSRYIGKTAGWYEVSGMVSFATNTTGRRYGALAVNGAAISACAASGVGMASSPVDVTIPVRWVFLNGTTDYIEIQGFSDQASWGTSVSGIHTSLLSIRFLHS